MERPTFNVAIFSGNATPDQRHIGMAEAIGKVLAARGVGVVNGGGKGLMERVAESAFMAGGFVLGVHFDFEGREKSVHNTETLSYTDLSERQKKIVELGDAYLALPGGLGTLYETLDVISLKYVGSVASQKPIVLLDRAHWQLLDSCIADLIERQYANPRIKDLYRIADSVDEAVNLLLPV
jgi:uncharacterized protein (TIGR00730 family)